MRTKEIETAAPEAQVQAPVVRRPGARRPLLVVLGGLAGAGLLAFSLQSGNGGEESPSPSSIPVATAPSGPAVDGGIGHDG